MTIRPVAVPTAGFSPGDEGTSGAATGALDHEVLADSGVRSLLSGYAALSGATLREIGPHRWELTVPPDDRLAFQNRATIRLAFSVEALQEDPEAEMAIVGSAFVEQLIAAVRTRGARREHGLVPPSVPPAAEAAPLPIPVASGAAGVPAARLARHPVGRLVARVTLKAGAKVEEHLVESGLFDLATGAALSTDVAEACERHQPTPAVPTVSVPPVDAPVLLPPAEARREDGAGAQGDGATLAATEAVPARSMGDLVELMLADLERRLAPQVEAQRAEAERALAHELARIDRYYLSMLEDSGGRGSELPDAASRRAVEAEHKRRREEEIQRHEVRAIVHPVQLAAWEVVTQRAEWPLESVDGHQATVVAQRTLLGNGSWAIACPTCGTASPPLLAVCRHGHAGCSACATACSVCTTGFCREHGIGACHVDGRPACDEHARTCRSCRQVHCSTHEGVCTDGGHPSCTTCLAACATCGAVVCDSHATMTSATSLLGVRRICASCVRHCEGGTGEVVGPDEVVSCSSCSRVVCEQHRTVCAVDGQVHCSSHVRRTDRSRRLVCEEHRTTCAYEPNAVLALDEVSACATCGIVACAAHTEECVADGRRHCTKHMERLRDQQGRFGCEAHRTVCHIDKVAFSLTGTAECPVCRRKACKDHTRTCANCGRDVCRADLYSPGESRCATCRQLSPIEVPSDALVAAASIAVGDRGGRPKSWRGSRDATHQIAELDLGWTRRVVIAVRHGESTPDLVMRHSLLGTARQLSTPE